MNVDAISSEWAALTAPTQAAELDAREVSDVPDVWVALDHRGERHLLILVPEGSSIPSRETHGIRAVIARHRVVGRGEATYIDLTCVADEVGSKFDIVVADVIKEIAGQAVDDRPERISSTLSQWRWFWDVDPDGLSSIDAVGLFGELWFLSQWAKPVSQTVAAWEASEGARHDFQWPAVSVEVKTTSRSGPARHRIEPLSQLENPATGRLFLFSLRISRDRLARNSLATLVEGISTALANDPEARATFTARVARRGYTPTNRSLASQGYRIASEGLYQVTDNFPRLREETIERIAPQGVESVSYELVMDSCEQWLRTRDAASWSSDGPR